LTKFRALCQEEKARVSGFSCTSRRTGLRCRNRSGHGFSLSRTRSFRF
jgi:hypothetical protein